VPETEVEQVTSRFVDAYNRRDWDAVRALFADDMVVEDRQPARGFADVRGGDEFVIRLKAGIDDIPDRVMGDTEWLSRHPHAGVGRNQFRGHDAFGGGEVVHDRIGVIFTANGRYQRLVFFEPDDEASALAYLDAAT
jgi:hypothetical protein